MAFPIISLVNVAFSGSLTTCSPALFSPSLSTFPSFSPLLYLLPMRALFSREIGDNTRPRLRGLRPNFLEIGLLHLPQPSAGLEIPNQMAFGNAIYPRRLGVLSYSGAFSLVDCHPGFSHNDIRGKWYLSPEDVRIFDMCWTQDDLGILTASFDHRVRFWDSQSMDSVYIGLDNSAVLSVSAHPDNPEQFVSGSYAGSLCFWDKRDPSSSPIAMKVNAHPFLHVGGALNCVQFASDGFQVITGSSVSCSVRIWDLRCLDDHVVQVDPLFLNAEGFQVSNICTNSSGTKAAVTCDMLGVYMFDLLMPDRSDVVCFYDDDIWKKSAFCPDDDDCVLVSGVGNGNARVWQFDKPDQPFSLLPNPGDALSIHAFSWSSYSNRVYFAANFAETVKLYWYSLANDR